MKLYLGIDLGSTTSKAVIIDEHEQIIGRGITNTRSDYRVAADIARMEAEFNSRFTILHRKLKSETNGETNWTEFFSHLKDRFHFLQFRERFYKLVDAIKSNLSTVENPGDRSRMHPIIHNMPGKILSVIRDRFLSGEVSTTSDFFRDLFSSAYMQEIEHVNKDIYDQLVAIYDRAINPIENENITFDFGELLTEALDMMPEDFRLNHQRVERHLEFVAKESLEPTDYVGTGYGRQLLPFEEKHIKSEILCHAMGAHACFPNTRTVLDIGGQDTKAIQVDRHGFVTSFQMNDRCAAGCGRYLGYIADEMSISVSELGPLAMGAEYEANICSTCTVFAGAELREYLNLGEKKENILAGLHLAIVQRAFALLARSGGVYNEFTFTGGVARNSAVVKYVKQLVIQNYGEMKINCHTDSIFMGALGGALFSARRK